MASKGEGRVSDTSDDTVVVVEREPVKGRVAPRAALEPVLEAKVTYVAPATAHRWYEPCQIGGRQGWTLARLLGRILASDEPASISAVMGMAPRPRERCLTVCGAYWDRRTWTRWLRHGVGREEVVASYNHQYAAITVLH